MDDLIRPTQPNNPGDGSLQPETRAPEPSPIAPLPPVKQPLKNKFKPKWLALVAIVFVLIGGGIFALKSVDKKTEAPATPAKKEIPLVIYGTADGTVDSFYPGMPLLTVNTELNSQSFEGLVTYEDGTKIKPLLANSWTNPDDTTWVFELKQNVKFHTGRTMTAKDVKYSLENFKDTETGSVFATTIKSVEVVDDYKVKVITNGPDPILLNKLVFLYIIDSQSKKKDDPINGTGAYTLKPDTKATKTKTELVAYDEYHQGRPLTRSLTFRFYEDEVLLTEARQKGQITIASDVFDQKNVDLLKANSTTFAVQSTGVYNIGINVKKAGSPVQKLKVREAIYLATDPEALMKARNVLGNEASQIVTQDIPGYNPTITRPKRDITQAKQKLKEAGYPNGVTITLTYFNPAKDAADELVRQLKEAGITVKLDGFDDPEVLTKKTDTGGSEINFSRYETDTLDAMQVFTDNFQNANYDNPAINKLIVQANKTLDPAKRLSLLQDISKLLMDDVAWVPLYSYTTHWMHDPTIVITKDLPGTTIGAYFWKVYAK